jgi:hypothetical protein
MTETHFDGLAAVSASLCLFHIHPTTQNMAPTGGIPGGNYKDETTGQTQSIEAQSSMEETNGGLSLLLACCGVLKAPALAEEENNSFDSIERQKYEQAAFQLLRTKSSSPSNFTRILHIRQTETWDCGKLFFRHDAF